HAKLRAPLRLWMEEFWHDRQEATCREAQVALEAHFGVRMSQSHLSRVRTALRGPPPRGMREKGGDRKAPAYDEWSQYTSEHSCVARAAKRCHDMNDRRWRARLFQR